MKKFLSIFLITLSFILFPLSSSAESIYLPTSSSDQYLPTVKIHAFSIGYDGNLTAMSLGSGTLIDDQGHLLTNNHVIEDYYDTAQTYDAFQICLTKANDTENPICEFTAGIVARNQDMDLAILKIEDTDVRGSNISFDFYLPYNAAITPEVGQTINALGYPDTGGKTLTVTQGIISGFLNENNISYIKTDTDISFGNSGGTAIDSSGNLIGVPTLINTSYSSETLGYLVPLNDTNVQEFITTNISGENQFNTVANTELKDQMLKYIEANDKGIYKHDYPPYQIAIIDGWKIGNKLEGAFDGESYSYDFSYGDTVTVFPKEKDENSALSASISVSEFGYEVTTDDIISVLKYYSSEEEEINYEKVLLNDKYNAVKETRSYIDYWSTDEDTIFTVSYYIPYGDKLISLYYSYGSAEIARLAEVDQIIESFEVDMNQIQFEEIKYVENKDPYIKVKKPLGINNEIYLTDSSYSWDNATYFGANYQRKSNFDFGVSIFANEYYFDEYVGDFAYFQEDTMSYLDTSSLISKGVLRVDGHDGFYYITQYDYGDGDIYRYLNAYIEINDNWYLSIYYSNNTETFDTNFKDINQILKNIELSNNGTGIYLIPNFAIAAKKTLTDIENHVYEDNIRSLYDYDILPSKSKIKFDPEGALSRGEFVEWVGRSLKNSEDFIKFESTYLGCTKNCFEDIDYNGSSGIYIKYAQSKEIITGQEIDGKKYFFPDEQMSLMAAYKILFELYEYETWKIPEGLDIPWYMPYLLLAYKENLVPYGVDEIDHMLKRGEGAYILDLVIYNNSDDSYEDDWY